MIRPYEDRDLEQMLDTWAAAAAIAHPFLSDTFMRQERHDIEHVYLPLAETWVWEADGRVAGFIALVGNEIRGLFVAPQHQRKGIGRSLVDHARTLRDDLEVDVFEANPIGRAFYSRYGFEPMLEKVHDATGQGVMRLRLAGARPPRAGDYGP